MLSVAPTPDATPQDRGRDDLSLVVPLLERIADTLARLDRLTSTSSPNEWLTLNAAAEYARFLRPDGTPTDKFYTAVKRELGKRSRVRTREVDDLIERGVL